MTDLKAKRVKPNYYELLEVSMSADEEEIRRTYDRIKNIYAEDSLITYGLYSDQEIKEFREQVEQAFRILVDEENRRDYDRSLIAEPLKRKKSYKVSSQSDDDDIDSMSDDGVMEKGRDYKDGEGFDSDGDFDKKTILSHRQSTTSVKKSRKSQQQVVIPEDAVITGELLKDLRKEADIDLKGISENIKVSVTNLRNLEDENWESLPAWVYVRGFIIQYAKSLKIPPDNVLEAMKDHFQEWKNSQAK